MYLIYLLVILFSFQCVVFANEITVDINNGTKANTIIWRETTTKNDTKLIRERELDIGKAIELIQGQISIVTAQIADLMNNKASLEAILAEINSRKQ